jgi:hypothetical protein
MIYIFLVENEMNIYNGGTFKVGGSNLPLVQNNLLKNHGMTNPDRVAKLRGELDLLQTKLLEQDGLTLDEHAHLDKLIATAIEELPPIVATPLINLRVNCSSIEESLLTQEHSPAALEHGLAAVEGQALTTRDYIASLELNMQLPFTILSVQILSSSTKIMAAQANVALKKLELMTKLIEQLQALTSLLTEITNQLNNTFSNKAVERANNGGTDIDQNTINWSDIVSNAHGQTKRREAYDLSYLIDTHVFCLENHFKADEFYKFLLNNGYIIMSTSINHQIFIAPKALNAGIMDKDGYFYLDKLPADQKQEFLAALEWTKTNHNSNYKDWAENYKQVYKFTDFPEFYNQDGKKIAADDSCLENSIIFNADKIPPILREFINPLTSLYKTSGSHQGEAATAYAFSADALQGAFKKLVTNYVQAVGEVPEDFNQKMTGSLTGTAKDVDNLARILQQKIQYIQQKQEALAKAPENAKEDSNRKLDLLQNILHSTTF